MHGYHYRKWENVWRYIAGKLPPAVLFQKCGRILEKMAHYTWCVVQNVYILSGISLRNGKKMEQIWKKTSEQIYNEAWDFRNGTFSGLAL